MTTTTDIKHPLKIVDIIKDREYILAELKKSETEESYSLEESYNRNMKKLSQLAKQYETV